MKKYWTTTKLIAIGGLAALDVSLALFGGIISSATGIPLAGGVVNNIIENSFVVFTLLLMDRFGTGIIFRFVVAALELPLPLLGAPGFGPKIIIGLVAGLLADIIYLASKRNKIVTSFLIGGLIQIWIVYSVVIIGRLVKMPGVEKTALVIMSAPLLMGAVVLGGLGGVLGYFIFKKVKGSSAIERLQQQ